MTPGLFDALRPKKKELPAEAPLVLKLEVWPDELRARGTVTQGGKTRDLEVSTPVLKMVLAALRATR